MNIGQIADNFFVSPQLMPDHIAQLASKGIKTIINNRPDGENGIYPSDAEMAQLASDHGMEYLFIPVNPKTMTTEMEATMVDTFSRAMKELPGPVVGYCASGYRSAMIWALASASASPREKSADEIIAACASQGHNLSQMHSKLTQMAQAA